MIRPRSRCAPPGRHPHLETLEDRCLPSATGGVLPNVAVESAQASDHILVRFLSDAKPVALAGTIVGKAEPLVANLYEIDLAAGETVALALAAYRQNARVDYAEADSTLAVAWTPNDPYYNLQYNLKNTGQNGGTAGADVNASAAWSVTANSMRIPIAVFDTGIDYTHPDLYDNIWINQKEIPLSRLKNLVDYYHDGYISMRDLNAPGGINQGPGKITRIDGKPYVDGADLIAPMTKDVNGNDTGNGGWADGISEDHSGYVDDLIGWNFASNNNNPMDGFGHGTHVAGIIAAMGNDGTGVSGVDWQAQLVPVKFFDDQGNGSISSFINGLNWALAQGIKLSNNSWTDGGYTPALFDAINAARSKGALLVVAAGNSGVNTDSQPSYPADFPLDNIISVGATDNTGHLAGFSNFGVKSVDVAAPGVNILSTTPGNTYGYKSGTSMAAPEVTGVAALVWALRPEWTYQQVIAQVLNSATRTPALNGKVATGMLNAYAAIQVPPRTAPPSSHAPSGSATKTASVAPSGAARAASVASVAAAPQARVTSVIVASFMPSDLAPGVGVVTTSAPVAAASHAPPAIDDGLSLGLAADLFGSLAAPAPGVVPSQRAKPSGNGE